ncbi:MAG: YicC/YloC family endoribonuclease [Betaproteobacteria bacterium]
MKHPPQQPPVYGAETSEATSRPLEGGTIATVAGKDRGYQQGHGLGQGQSQGKEPDLVPGHCHSMTGFGSASERWEGWSILVDARSVNGRFVDFSLRCPDEVRALEPVLREAVSRVVHRGKVEMRITLRRDSNTPAPLSINLAAITQLHHLINQLPWDMTEHRAPAPLELLRFPGVLNETNDTDQHALLERVAACAQQALESLRQARRDEGLKIDQFLRERLRWMSAALAELQQCAREFSASYERRLRERITLVAEEAARALNPTEFAQRIALEVSIHGMRIDIAEEISRLQSHLEEVLGVLARGGACGKRLDFLMQELHREANTIGSKSSTLKQSHASIDLKVWIEQMREQVQNIE